MTDDRTLLQRYAAHRDEAAFAEVVRRHLPFVYSAALRRLGRDTHRAQDVAQTVFCALARDAGRIAPYPVLSGWLYTATRNAVCNLVRAEKRRRTREEEASHMQQIESEPEAADWSTLRPVLDSAMDQLSAPDREAVLLRFFEGRSFGEIGAIIGSSEEAARKRTDRALTRLRDLLRPRGVAPSSATLAALLAAQPVSAAPAGVLASVTRAALSTGGAAALEVATFITMTKLQASMAAAIVLAGAIGLIIQQRTISALRADAGSAQARSAQLKAEKNGHNLGTIRGRASAEPTTADSRARNPADGSAGPGARDEMLAATSAALQNGKLPEGYFAFAGVLQQLTRDNWRQVRQGFEEERKRTGLGHPPLVEVFVRRAGEVAGRDAVDYFLKNGWGGNTNEATASWVSNEAMIGWASQNPAEALQWLGHDADPETRRKLMGAAIRGLALTEPDLAVKTLEDQPAKERSKYTHELVTSALRAVGIAGAQRLVEGMIARAAENDQLKEAYLRNVVHDYCSMRIYQATASGTVADALDWMNRRLGQPYFDNGVITEVTRRFTLENPPEAFRWLEGVNNTLMRGGETSPVGYRMLLDAWKAKEGAPAVETWLRAQQSHPHYDYLARQYTAIVVEQDTNKALGWANTIKDAAIKQEAMQLINRRGSRAKS